jgi:hypothetical protein
MVYMKDYLSESRYCSLKGEKRASKASLTRKSYKHGSRCVRVWCGHAEDGTLMAQLSILESTLHIDELYEEVHTPARK